MATSTPVPSRPRAFAKLIAVVLIALLLCALGIALWLRSALRSALPQLDGTLQVPGLAAPVIVIRDNHGVPAIQASNLDDLFFAQGYVTAQDRLFQMDGMRRFAAGELSEIVGESQLEHDRQQRILGLTVAARRTVAVISAEDRSHFEAYARGVNAFIETHRDRLPIEFRILRYSPQPWTIEDSALIGAYMVEDLSTSPRHALTREKILAKLGPELTADLYVNFSWRDRLPTVSRPGLEHTDDKDSVVDSSVAADDPDNDFGTFPARAILRGLKSAQNVDSFRQPTASFFDDRPLVLGSNNWVVSGAHTVTGKPLLSNDMHLGHQMPNLWFAAHLHCGDLDVAGVTLPGYPYVIVGHNQRIAWGFTNIGPTIEDVYIETFNAAGQYLTPEGWKQPDHRQEVIHVKGRPDVTVDVLLTRHGPIVTDLVPGETRKLALRWTLYDGIRNPFFAVDSSRNWEEFQHAFSEFDAPGQNVVYADVDGNIGYHATGKVPIRASGDGSLPENGSDNAHEWVGYVPFEKLPSALNPPSGVIATANGRIPPDDYPYSLSVEWEAPWRTARIYRVLESGKKFSAADMLGLQMDIHSELDRFFTERFVYAVDHATNPSPRAKTAADILRQWDGRMTADSAAPTIAVRAREELTRLLLEPKLGQAPKDPVQAKSTLNWKSYSWMMETIWLDNVVQHQPKRWLPDAYANYDELLAAAVNRAVSRPDAPKDLNSWRWGAFDAVEIQNPVLGQFPIFQHWTGPGLREQSGSPYTVKAAAKTYGPSERITVDLADLDQSTLNLVTGEAGNFLSPYYLDQWDAWYKGFTFAWPYTAEAIQRGRSHELMLQPGK
ncbi:MAG TPA: penicillin acylase family protein [Terriglobales bacterium]|nr:penicillin acylase family protein [Terriglobales bacterium]